MKHSHAEFGSEVNEFENELLKSGSESTIGRMQPGYFIVEQNAVKSGNVDERDMFCRLFFQNCVVRTKIRMLGLGRAAWSSCLVGFATADVDLERRVRTV